MTAQPQPEPPPAAALDDERQRYIDDLNRLWNERKAERQRRAADYEARKAELEPAQPAPEPSANPYAGMDRRLAKALQSFGATIKAREEREAEAPPEPLKPATPEVPAVAQVIMFPQWGDERRAASAAIFRSALFPPLNFKKARPFLKEAEISATRGIEIYFTGEQFDQSDLDVYLELLHIARAYPFGVECCFTAYGFLKALGRATGKANHKWLHSVLIRLCGGVVDMTDHKTRYFGHLVESGIKDEVTKHYRVRLNPEMARLFHGDLWASLDIQQRRALGRNQTAKAAHAYLSSNVGQTSISYEKLSEIIGLKNTSAKDVKRKMVRVFEAMKEVGFVTDFETGTDIMTFSASHTPSQNRHLVRKATGATTPTKRRKTDTKED